MTSIIIYVVIYTHIKFDLAVLHNRMYSPSFTKYCTEDRYWPCTSGVAIVFSAVWHWVTQNKDTF